MRTDQELLNLSQKYKLKDSTNIDSSPNELRGSDLLNSLSENENFSMPGVPVKKDFTDKLGEFGSQAGRSIWRTAETIQNIPRQALGMDKLMLPEELTRKGTTPTEKAGGAFGEAIQYLTPMGAETAAAKGATLLGKLLSKAPKLVQSTSKLGVKSLVGGTEFAGKTALMGGDKKEVTEAGAFGFATPLALKSAQVILKPVVSVVSRLFSGLGAGLSGVSNDTLKTIASNPKVASDISKKILSSGQESILENNARTIMNGVSKIKKEASSMYGKGLENLKTVDIKPSVIAKNTLSVLDKNGIKIINDKIDLSASEILDTKIQNRAKELLNQINEQTTADGKNLRSLMEKIESSKFKSGLQDPNRMSFNVLLNDLSKGLRNSINESTDKLKQINKKYSADMDLSNSIQDIFGDIKFKNTSELNNVARKLENLFSQKGLDPKTVDNFLVRIGVSPSEFKTSEAVRKITTKTTGANTKGLSVGEIFQQITSSVVTPRAVRNIAIATGLTKDVIEKVVKNYSPGARKAVITGLIEANK